MRWHELQNASSSRLHDGALEASTLTLKSIYALTAFTHLEHDPKRVREVLRRFLHRAHPTAVKPMR